MFTFLLLVILSVSTSHAATSSFQLEYLKQFGYISTTTATPVAINNIPRFLLVQQDDEIDAIVTGDVIKQLQLYADVNQTGQFDEATIGMLMTPRCQNPDVIEKNNRLSQYFLGETESTRKKRQATESSGPKWEGSLNLTFAFENVTPQNPRVQQIIGSAFNSWAECSYLNFTMVNISGNPDIKIRFASGEHAPPARDEFDGRGGVLAHAWYPPVGLAHFDEDEDWTNDCYMFAVALHEIGHLLGLDHEPRRSSIMFAYFDARDVVNTCDENMQRPLSASDLTTIRAKYGSVACSKAPDPTQSPENLDDPSSSATLDNLQDITTSEPGSPTPNSASSQSTGSVTISGSLYYKTSQGPNPWKLECGEVRDNVLNSPEYPSIYPNGMNCSWSVATPADGATLSRIAVNFIEFEVEDGLGGECVFDYVRFSYVEAGVMKTLDICGIHYQSLTFNTDSLKIEFLSDSLKQYRGFKLLFTFEGEAPCKVMFEEPEGMISYPGYADAEDYQCTYHIRASNPEKKVLVIIEYLSADCDQFELLTEEDGTDSLMESCHDGIRHYISPEDSFYLKFKNTVDSLISFSLRYYSISANQCNDAFVEAQQWWPPGSKQQYLPDQDCILAVKHTDQNAKEITIKFSNTISLEDDKFCSYDFVEVYTVEHGRARLCGELRDREYKTHHDFLIYFHSDASVEAAGFLVEYAYETCDREIVNKTGVIENEEYGLGYPPFSSCSYNFPPDGRYFVCFDQLDLSRARCRDDYIERVTSAGETEKFCNARVAVMLDEGDTMRFESGEGRSPTSGGFRFQYFAIDHTKYSCYKEMHVYYQRHPHVYSFNSHRDGSETRCLWMITTEPGHHLELSFDKYKLKGSCQDDYIHVLSDRQGCQGTTICKKASGVRVGSRVVYMFFKVSSQKSSFRLKIKVVEADTTTPPPTTPNTHWTVLYTNEPTTSPQIGGLLNPLNMDRG